MCVCVGVCACMRVCVSIYLSIYLPIDAYFYGVCVYLGPW